MPIAVDKLCCCVQAATDVEQPLLQHSSNGAAATPAEPQDSAAQPPTQSTSLVLGQLCKLSAPDTHVLLVALACGLLAAVGQALLPMYTGRSIDAAGTGADANWPRFFYLIKCLVGAAVFTAITASGRGSLFTLVTARINKRLRERLFAQLLKQVRAQYCAVHDTIFKLWWVMRTKLHATAQLTRSTIVTEWTAAYPSSGWQRCTNIYRQMLTAAPARTQHDSKFSTH